MYAGVVLSCLCPQMKTLAMNGIEVDIQVEERTMDLLTNMEER